MHADELHLAILNELQTDARISNAEIGRRVGLTAPAVSERIKRMQEEGVIKGFAVNINFKQLHYSEKVLIGVKLPNKYDNHFLIEVDKVAGLTDVIRTTGEYCFFVWLTLRSVEELDDVLRKFGEFGDTLTFSILSTPIESKPIDLLAKKKKGL